ncbi:MAG: response regulator transcription factor [Planctomycetes bacterium]|nr:response regulator transcription factor [Planctomycetota bacterium]
MQKRRILVIEDDAAIRVGIVDALAFAGFETAQAGDGEAGLALALEAECDLILLDLVLPGRDGLDILGQIRKHRPTLPVIILTARGSEGDRVRGLRLGADDYVVKPFSVRELLARVDAVLRRSPERANPIEQIPIAGGTADLARQEIRFDDGGREDLTEREVELLRYLASNAGRALSRDEILQRVWRLSPRGIETRTIDMHIARLRQKLRDDPDEPAVIRTVRGKGYMFGEPGETS